MSIISYGFTNYGMNIVTTEKNNLKTLLENKKNKIEERAEKSGIINLM